jgi:hypothetical protein
MVTTSEKCGKGEWLLKGNELISKYQLNLDNSESCLLEPEKILGLLIWVDGGQFKLATPPAILEESSHRRSVSWLASFHEALGAGCVTYREPYPKYRKRDGETIPRNKPRTGNVKP